MKANVLNGKDLMLWIGGKVVALSKSCSVSISAATGDANTKDSGVWDDNEVVGLSWSMSNESVDSADANRTNDQVFDALFDKMIAHQPVTITFGKPSNASDAGLPAAGWTAPATGGYTGSALITSLDRNGAKGSNASVTISLTGVGALSRAAGSGSGN